MSARSLPREHGVVIVCDGGEPDEPPCGARFHTANVFKGVNRRAAAALGWIRGLTKGRKRLDLCPLHAAAELEKKRADDADREVAKRARDEKRKKVFAQPSTETAPAP